MHDNAPETDEFVLAENDGNFKITNKCACLGANIDFMLDNASDTRCRKLKANEEMCDLKFVWESKEVSLGA